MDAPAFELIMKLVKVSGEMGVSHQSGAVLLDGFPRLVYDGQSVRTEDTGTPVATIADAYAENPDPGLVAAIYGMTSEHVAEAVRYTASAGHATAGQEFLA